MFNMASKRKYKNPAIKEAIFEAKFNYDSFDSAVPGQIFEQIKTEYPHKQDIKHELVFLEKDTSVPASSMPAIQAPLMRVRKDDHSELLQFGPGIVVANRLKYSTWEDFIPSIKKITNAYLDTAKPQTLTRVGMRYINSFLIPESNTNILDYFKININIPDSLCSLNGFNLSLMNTIAIDEFIFNIRTRFLTDALTPNETGNKFILDTDCYVLLNIAPNTDQIISLATKAHNILGNVFEDTITDKTRALMGDKQ